MPTVSSHVLDSVSGGSAVGVRVDLTRVDADGARTALFSCVTDHEGRINQSVELDTRAGSDLQATYELEFHTAAYFLNQQVLSADDQVMDGVIVRIRMNDPEKQRYHIPIMASPHSYSLWWSR